MPNRLTMARIRCLVLAACCAVAAAATLAPHSSRAEDSELARAVKATFLYKFAPFVEWPDSAFVSSASPFRICIVGDDSFGRLVQRAAAGQRVRGREMVVALYESVRQAANCHILYAGAYGADPVAEIVAAQQGRPVLTVTDEANGDTAKGIVHFVIMGGRVRFEIDLQLAEADGLKISPKVLELAVEVRK